MVIPHLIYSSERVYLFLKTLRVHYQKLTIIIIIIIIIIINNNNNNNNNICLKSNIQTSSVDYAPRELTHACSRSETCSRSDTEACDMCYVF